MGARGPCCALFCPSNKANNVTLNRQQILPVWTALVMSIIMSGVITAINTGLSAGFVGRWGHAWLFAWPLATLSAYFARPIADKLTTWTLAKLGQ
jgi:hypothetical protein